jgi:hypothetical protein
MKGGVEMVFTKKTSTCICWSLVIVLMVLCGCGRILVKPDVFSVKKMAIISVYANHEIYNVKSAKTQKEGLSALKAAVGKAISRTGESLDSEERIQISTYTLKVYEEMLNSIDPWTVLPTPEVINNQQYKAMMEDKDMGAVMAKIKSTLMKVGTAEWVMPPGLHYIPFSSVAKTGSKTYVNGKEVHEEARKKMAALCRDLGVDGVVIIHVDLAYKSGMLSGMRGTGIFSGVLGRATPSVSTAMVVITKDGRIAAQTSAVTRGGGRRYESDAAPMLKKGVVYLKDKKGKAVHQYNVAVEKSAAGLKEKILKELSKG